MDFNAALGNEDQVPATITMDLESVTTAIREKFLPAIEGMTVQAEAHQITDQPTFESAIAMGGQVKDLTKRLEKARKETIEEPDSFVRGINKAVKAIRDKLDGIENGLKAKINAHQRKLEQERREAERKAQEEAARLQKEMEKAAKKLHIAPPAPVVAPVVPQVKVHRAETGASVHLRKVWKFEIVDISKVPGEYLLVETAAVNRAIKSGIREIPGLRVYEEDETVMRF